MCCYAIKVISFCPLSSVSPEGKGPQSVLRRFEEGIPAVDGPRVGRRADFSAAGEVACGRAFCVSSVVQPWPPWALGLSWELLEKENSHFLE